MSRVIQIRRFHAGDQPLIARTDGGPAWHSSPQLWSAYLAEQSAGGRIVLLATIEDSVVGYGSLVLDSAYPPFRAKGIPEINNLVVAAEFRRHGIGSALIDALEAEARRAGRVEIGIGFGLYPDYGPAHRLYVKLGFVPDGLGTTYLHEPVRGGATLPIDDDLVLWLTRTLKEN